jgi:hypothetical protein
MPAPDNRALNEVSTVLWRERKLLELLAFKLEEERLILMSGRTRWLYHAVREVELVLEQIKAAELVRAVTVDGAAGALGLGSVPGLRALAEAAPEPWSTIFFKHRTAFLELTQEVKDLSEANHEMLVRGRAAVRDALEWVNGGSVNKADGYSANGALSHTPSFHFLVNESI